MRMLGYDGCDGVRAGAGAGLRFKWRTAEAAKDLLGVQAEKVHESGRRPYWQWMLPAEREGPEDRNRG